MAKKFAKLKGIHNNRPVTREKDEGFLFELEKALLLALREQGRLNALQYRRGEELLKDQRRERVRALQEEA